MSLFLVPSLLSTKSLPSCLGIMDKLRCIRGIQILLATAGYDIGLSKSKVFYFAMKSYLIIGLLLSILNSLYQTCVDVAQSVEISFLSFIKVQTYYYYLVFFIILIFKQSKITSCGQDIVNLYIT